MPEAYEIGPLPKAKNLEYIGPCAQGETMCLNSVLCTVNRQISSSDTGQFHRLVRFSGLGVIVL